MKNNYLIGGLAIFLFFFPFIGYAIGPNTIEYSGRLVALPCTVHPDNDDTYVFFGHNINTKDQYTGKRGDYSDKEFSFKLENCNVSLGKTISAKFIGNSTVDGMLKLDAGSEASGIVIGLETMSGQALPINNTQVESIYPIKNGDLTITLRAYLKADANSLANKSIKTGLFNATMTYILVYE
ncbi:fimbrial protein [Providencia manganoxydans]|uniref:fimbrial protein n=1 Tax=Providencia manganoxydans TaxID=2923283 RepID=UPI0034DD2170